MRYNIGRYIDNHRNEPVLISIVHFNLSEQHAEKIVVRLNTQAGHKYIDEHTFITKKGSYYYMIE